MTVESLHVAMVDIGKLTNLGWPTFNWRERLSVRDLLLFEAFVAHVGRSVSHQECARLALKRFPQRMDGESLARKRSRGAMHHESTRCHAFAHRLD
jgi:hypothetical protein